MMPKSRLGRWAGRSLVVFFVLFILVVLGVNLRWLLRGSPTVIALGACTMVAGLATFVTGVVSLARNRDRSFVVILAVVVGSIAIVLFGMEMIEMIGGLTGAS